MTDSTFDLGIWAAHNREQLAGQITELHFQRYPELEARYGPAGRLRCRQDNLFHLDYLVEAVRRNRVSLWADYVAWARGALDARGIPLPDLEHVFESIGEIVTGQVPPEIAGPVSAFLSGAMDAADRVESSIPTFLGPERPLAQLSRTYLNHLLGGERRKAARLIMDAAEVEPLRLIYLEVFQRAQWEVGRLWQLNRISVAEEHYCTAATQWVMSMLYPKLFELTSRGDKVVVATCVSDDLHEIGVRMVADFFELEGWDSHYLGANTPDRDVLALVEERQADVLAISATLTKHLSRVEALVKDARARFGGDTTVLVGGYPFNLEPQLWRDVGADGSARDCQAAVELARNLVQ